MPDLFRDFGFATRLLPLVAVLGFFGISASASAASRPVWDCPKGFTPKAGLNVDFSSDGVRRAFVVVPPKDAAGPLPVWVPMVGTVEATNWNLYRIPNGNNARLADAGFMVIAPVRECADQDPNLAAGACNGSGHDGWSWNPWHEGRAPDAAGDRFKTDAGPDVRFLEAMVRCVGTKWKLDRKRLFIGGISSGGTMTNRALLFDSSFWAGGMPISGEWYATRDDGSSMPFLAARDFVGKDPTKIYQGRVGPYPLPGKLDPMIVLTVWGGPNDKWDCGPPIGPCSDYRPTTQASSNYYSSIPGIVHVACSTTDGHRWPQINTDAFNLWALRTLASHPKGSSVCFFQANPAPPRLYVPARPIYGSLLMRFISSSLVFAAATAVFAGAVVHGQQQSTVTPAGRPPITTATGQIAGAAPAGAPDGASLYQARCAGCHEHADGRVPSREVISQNPASFILSTLRNGVMAPMAQGLSLAEESAIAHYVSKVPDDPKATKDVDVHRIWGDSVEGTALDGPKCASAPGPIDLKTTVQWNGWSPTKDNARYQANPGLSASEVPRLKLKWAFQYPGAKNGQATVVGDRLFVTSMSGAIYALNAKTGCVYWRHAAAAATRTSVTVAALPAGSPARYAIFFADWTKAAVALDAETGKQLWKTTIDDQPGEQMTGSLTYWDGKIFVPISSGNEAFAQSPTWDCCKFRGALVALDAKTGTALWKRYTTDVVPHPFKRNSAGHQMWGPSGGSIWTAPTVDPARRLIYVGTSNSYTDVPYDHADSVMAIEADTGKIRWSYQLTLAITTSTAAIARATSGRQIVQPRSARIIRLVLHRFCVTCLGVDRCW